MWWETVFIMVEISRQHQKGSFGSSKQYYKLFISYQISKTKARMFFDYKIKLNMHVGPIVKINNYFAAFISLLMFNVYI